MPVSIPNKEGKISVYAEENENYVEISIQDNGLGLSVEDKERILSEKVYDSGKIGLQSTENAAELQKNKGHGFGLMNCKGIIDKYRKTNDIFRICTFNIESEPGRGSRFFIFFRLPKGIRKILMFDFLYILLYRLFEQLWRESFWSDRKQ